MQRKYKKAGISKIKNKVGNEEVEKEEHFKDLEELGRALENLRTDKMIKAFERENSKIYGDRKVS